MHEFQQALYTSEPITLWAALRSLILALILTQVLAAVYVWTFRGMSYTRSFVHAIVIGGVICAMLMLAINDSIAAGLGIAGSLAIIRFRTAMRDPRDIVFIFAGMGAGIAAGLGAHQTAIAGTSVFCLAAITLTVTEYGQRRQFDGLLRFQAPSDADTQRALARLLQRYSSRFALVSMRETQQGATLEHAYQVRLKRLRDRATLVHELQRVPHIEDVSVHYQDETIEI